MYLGPGKATGLPAPGNMSLFRANLWNNMEVLTDHLASITNQVNLGHRQRSLTMYLYCRCVTEKKVRFSQLAMLLGRYDNYLWLVA